MRSVIGVTVPRLFLLALGLTCATGCAGPDNSTAPRADAEPDSNAAGGDQPPAEHTEPDAADIADGAKITLAGIEFTVPDGWLRQPRSSSTRAAEYVLAAEAGDASLTVYYFGQQGAGTRQAHVKQWIAEYSGSVSSRAVTQPSNNLMLTIVHVSGAFAPARTGGQSATPPKSGYNTLGVIIESGPHGPLYVKAVGPAVTIQLHMVRLDAFIASARHAPTDDD
jgi:hypothetical protein